MHEVKVVKSTNLPFPQRDGSSSAAPAQSASPLHTILLGTHVGKVSEHIGTDVEPMGQVKFTETRHLRHNYNDYCCTEMSVNFT